MFAVCSYLFKENLVLFSFKRINITPFFCYQLLYNLDNIKKNSGFYIFIFFLTIQIIFFYALIKYELIQLKSNIFKVDNYKKNLNLNKENLFILWSKN